MSSRTAKTRAWTFPTSPRVPLGVIDDLKILKQLEGSVWDKYAQLRFAKKLAESQSYKGAISKKETTFAARDRTRSPKLLGLIKTHLKGRKAEKIIFTEMGNEFIKDHRSYKKLFERQVLKVQYPNSVNKSGGYENMNIRPATFLIEMLMTLEYLTKTEIKTFCITQTRAEDISKIIPRIIQYREKLSTLKGKERKDFKHSTMIEAIKEAYEEDISLGNISTREGEKNFYRTKINYLNDFGDTCSRMMLATGIFVSANGFFCISESRREEAKYYLDTLGTGISEHDINDHESFVMNYMGSSSKPVLVRDDPTLCKNAFNGIYSRLQNKDTMLEERFLNAKNVIDKEKAMDDLELKIIKQQKEKIEKSLAENVKSSIQEIDNQFKEIIDRKSEIINAVRPVFFEWNTWRSFVVKGGYEKIIPNFEMDIDGHPSHTATGNKPDLIIEYKNFWVIAEVTLMSGHKQFEAEFEPITRHIGRFQKEIRESGDERPVFGVFISPKINETIYPYLRVYSIVKTKIFGGRVNILPLDLELFTGLIKSDDTSLNFQEKLKILFDETFNLSDLESNNEEYWVEKIKKTVTKLSN